MAESTSKSKYGILFWIILVVAVLAIAADVYQFLENKKLKTQIEENPNNNQTLEEETADDDGGASGGGTGV